MRKGTKVKWKSQGGGYETEKRGKIVRVLSGDDVPRRIAHKEFPNHKWMFDGWQIPPGGNGKGYLVEVITGPNASPRLYMPYPKNLVKI